MQAGNTTTFGLRDAFGAGWRIFAARPWFWIRLEVLIPLLMTVAAVVIGAVLFGLLWLAGVGDPPLLVISVYLLAGVGLWSLLVSQLTLGKVWIDLRAVDGGTPTASDLFAKSHLLWRFAGAYSLFVLAVGIGLLLLVVPGVWLTLRWCCWAPAMVDRDLGVLASFAESERLTRGRRLKLLWFFGAALGVVLLATLLLQAFVEILFPSVSETLAGLLGVPLSWLYNPVILLSFTWIYRCLTERSADVAPAAE